MNNERGEGSKEKGDGLFRALTFEEMAICERMMKDAERSPRWGQKNRKGKNARKRGCLDVRSNLRRVKKKTGTSCCSDKTKKDLRPGTKSTKSTDGGGREEKKDGENKPDFL